MFKTIIQNTGWIFSKLVKEIPFLMIGRFLGYLNNYASRLLNSFTIAFIIDSIIKYIGNKDVNAKYLTYSLIAFGVYYIIVNLLAIIRNYTENLINFQTSYVIPVVLLQEKLQEMSIKTLEKPEIQNRVHRFRENKYVFNSASQNILQISTIIIALTIAILPLINLIPITILFLIIFSLPTIWINKIILAKLWSLDKKITIKARRGGDVSGSLTEPKILKEIKLTNSYNFLKKYFDDYVNTYFIKRKSIYVQSSILDILATILRSIAILFGMYQIIQLASEGRITVGQIAFYIAALTLVSDNIDNLSANLSNYFGLNLRITEIRKLLEHKDEEEIVEIESKEKLPKFTTPPKVVFENVSFRYPNSEQNIIENLNLTINQGEKIAIVGENGAGKTTLIQLLSGIYPVNSGKIQINGYNLNELEPSSWYENIGVLSQDYNTYSSLTAEENIAIGRPELEIKLEEIEVAAKNADAHEFITKYKKGYGQVLSERYKSGIRPSGGQWQKIAIARAFYRDPSVLILDEPTAAIDAVAEANIFDRIYKFIENKTVIIISHRFATVRNADRIIVFDAGKIIEEGTHDELLNLNGKYANAFKLQAKGYEK